MYTHKSSKKISIILINFILLFVLAFVFCVPPLKAQSSRSFSSEIEGELLVVISDIVNPGKPEEVEEKIDYYLKIDPSSLGRTQRQLDQQLDGQNQGIQIPQIIDLKLTDKDFGETAPGPGNKIGASHQ